MEIEVIKVEKNNDSERLVLQVLEDCNLGAYIVFDSTYNNGVRSNLHRHSYIFPNQNVKANDYILLYTQQGDSNKYRNRSGTTTWEFFWGLDVNVWNNERDEILLVKIQEYTRHTL